MAAVKPLRAAFEGGNHPSHRLVEQSAHQRLQQRRAELELDMEGEHRAADRAIGAPGNRLKNPMVVQIPERAFDIHYVDALRRLQGNARRVALAEHAEADDE